MVREDGLEDRLDTWRSVARETNNYFADELGINRSASITAVKPSGTVSQSCHIAVAEYMRDTLTTTSELYVETTKTH